MRKVLFLLVFVQPENAMETVWSKMRKVNWYGHPPAINYTLSTIVLLHVYTSLEIVLEESYEDISLMFVEECNGLHQVQDIQDENRGSQVRVRTLLTNDS